MQTNQAAVLPAIKAALEIQQVPLSPPGPNEVQIQNRAVAINPVDAAQQDTGMMIEKYPFILGADVAGVVVGVGEEVDSVRIGDRVMAVASFYGALGVPRYAAFQKYTIAAASLVARLPDNISFAQGAVLPLCCGTAASGLFQEHTLGLDVPTMTPTKKDSAVLVWGGSSVVGACAVQFLVNAGYRVFTTSSERNFGFCKEAGAEKVFDYNSNAVEDAIVEALQGQDLAGVFCSVADSKAVEACYGVARRSTGPNKVALVIPGQEKQAPDDIEASVAWGTAIQIDGIGAAIYHDFLPSALQKGKFLPKPEPMVAGHGLGDIQKGLDAYKAGVSATKIVVTL